MNHVIHYDIRSHIEDSWPQLAPHEVERLVEDVFHEWDYSVIADDIDASVRQFCLEHDIPTELPVNYDWEPR